jgi:hypothetical protein
MRHKLPFVITAVVSLLAGALLATMVPFKEERVVIGRVENVVLDDLDMKLKARVDTRAGMSSMNAKILKIIKPDQPGGKEWVRFELTGVDGSTKTVERTIVDWANIKSKGAKGGYAKRPVVMMDFCLGGRRIEGRVNLANRGAFLYPILMGRNILKAGDFLIDPERRFMERPGCI